MGHVCSCRGVPVDTWQYKMIDSTSRGINGNYSVKMQFSVPSWLFRRASGHRYLQRIELTGTSNANGTARVRDAAALHTAQTVQLGQLSLNGWSISHSNGGQWPSRICSDWQHSGLIQLLVAS
jgi:hypothetical protein